MTSATQDSTVTTLETQDAPATAPLNLKPKNVPRTLKAAGSDDALSGEKVTLTIHATEADGGTDAVFLSHNGYAYQVPRGVPCKVPKEVAQVIADAVVEVFKPGPGATFIAKSIPRYAYSITA